MSETTHERYKRALVKIAEGADEPVKLATEALRWHIETKTAGPDAPPSKWKLDVENRRARVEATRNQRKYWANELYNGWLAADRPPIATHAKKLGMTRSNLERLLRLAEHGWPWGKRRLGYTRSRDYRTAAEIHLMKYGEEV